MRALLIAIALTLGVSSQTDAQTCTTVQPSPAFVCVKGGWLPPGHPGIPAAPADPAPEPAKLFKVGRRYVKGTTDLFIVAIGQWVNGEPVLVASCNQVGEDCAVKELMRLLPANARANDWVEMPVETF